MNTEPKYLQLIYTRFAGATATQGSKIVASVPGRRTPVKWPVNHALSTGKNHEEAAWKALRWKFGDQAYKLLGEGTPPNDKGYAFVFERIDAQEI